MTRRSLGALAGALVVCLGCADRSPRIPAQLIGSWRAPSGKATLQFLPDQQAGIRVTTPDVDHTTWYSWQLVDANHVRLKPAARVIRPSTDLPGGTIFTFAVAGDELTLTGEDGASLTYKRESLPPSHPQ
jgi:hypothetical protein